MVGYVWLSVKKFCECVVRCLCVQSLCREGLWGCVWYTYVRRLSVVNFVECVVWWLMWVVFVVCVGGSVVL